jgi:hypothetical protein
MKPARAHIKASPNSQAIALTEGALREVFGARIAVIDAAPLTSTPRAQIQIALQFFSDFFERFITI